MAGPGVRTGISVLVEVGSIETVVSDEDGEGVVVTSEVDVAVVLVTDVTTGSVEEVVEVTTDVSGV